MDVGPSTYLIGKWLVMDPDGFCIICESVLQDFSKEIQSIISWCLCKTWCLYKANTVGNIAGPGYSKEDNTKTCIEKLGDVDSPEG